MELAKVKQAKCILGGGAALGFSHIGALKAISNEYQVRAIIGTSMGAIIGALYAFGYSAEEIKTIAEEQDFKRLIKLKINFFSEGFLNTKRIYDFFLELTNKKRIEDCNIQFASVSFDLNEKRTVIINNGLLADAMIASSNLPFLNKAYSYQGSNLVDGGVCYPLPMEFSNIFSSDLTSIAVNVLPPLQVKPKFLTNSIETNENQTNNLIYNSMIVNLYNQANLALDSINQVKPDIYINCFSESLKAWDFHRVNEFYQLGYHTSMQILSLKNHSTILDQIKEQAHLFVNNIKKDFSIH